MNSQGSARFHPLKPPAIQPFFTRLIKNVTLAADISVVPSGTNASDECRILSMTIAGVAVGTLESALTHSWCSRVCVAVTNSEHHRLCCS